MCVRSRIGQLLAPTFQSLSALYKPVCAMSPMLFCTGNLKEAIRQKTLMLNNKVKALEVALLALDIAKACQAIHKHNIIHGDLKPHNVLLTGDSDDERGWIGKIADFGLSVKIKRGEQHVSGIQHGTEGYVAPEVLQTRRMVKASDVYSFGIIMWEMWHARLYYEEYRHAQRRMYVSPVPASVHVQLPPCHTVHV